MNIPNSRWNGKWCKTLEFSLETQVLILFVLLFSPSFFIALLDNFIVRKSHQSLDYTNVVLVSMNWEGLIQQNPKKHILIEREKIRNRCKEFKREIWKFQVNPIWPGLFWSTTAWGEIWSTWARVMKHGMHIALPIVNSITYFLEPRS